MYSVCLMVSKVFLSECVEAGFSSDWKHEKFAVGAHVLVNTQNVVISRCYFAEDKFYYARAAKPLFSGCSLKLLLYHVLVAFASRDLLKFPSPS